MNTMAAFILGAANRGKELRVFDWEKAAKIIVERNPERAEAGLLYDMENTAGCIYENGKPIIDSRTYLASTWATPVIVIEDADDEDDEIECYRMESETPGWDAKTKWPKEALSILESKK